MPAPITLAKSAGRVLPDLTAPKAISDMSKDELIAMIAALAGNRPAAAFSLSVSKGGINEATGKPKAIGIVVQSGGKRNWLPARILRDILDHAEDCEAFLAANAKTPSLW